MSKYKVIFHLHDEERITTAISNVINLTKDLGKARVDIEMLMNGTGVKMMLKEGEYLHKIDYLVEKGVDFKICSNSLEGIDISKDELMEHGDLVSSGVGELVKKQKEGWNYIKV